MKRIASLLMLATRSTLWKAAGITLASCLAEAGLFLAALSGWQDTVRTAYYEYSNPMGLEGLLMQYPLSWCFRIGLVLVCAVLAFLGWEGSSRVSYTLRRLSVGHRALTLLWAGYGFFCLLFFWAAHLGTLLALCAAALPRLAPEFSGPQALFLACYRDPYLHSLLPLDDWSPLGAQPVHVRRPGDGGGQLLLPAAHGPPGLRHSAPGGALRPLLSPAHGLL